MSMTGARALAVFGNTSVKRSAKGRGRIGNSVRTGPFRWRISEDLVGVWGAQLAIRHLQAAMGVAAMTWHHSLAPFPGTIPCHDVCCRQAGQGRDACEA